jgi:hypothetical protein
LLALRSRTTRHPCGPCGGRSLTLSRATGGLRPSHLIASTGLRSAMILRQMPHPPTRRQALPKPPRHRLRQIPHCHYRLPPLVCGRHAHGIACFQETRCFGCASAAVVRNLVLSATANGLDGTMLGMAPDHSLTKGVLLIVSITCNPSCDSPESCTSSVYIWGKSQWPHIHILL